MSQNKILVEAVRVLTKGQENVEKETVIIKSM
jgi:hypothetical protein